MHRYDGRGSSCTDTAIWSAWNIIFRTRRNRAMTPPTNGVVRCAANRIRLHGLVDQCVQNRSGVCQLHYLGGLELSQSPWKTFLRGCKIQRRMCPSWESLLQRPVRIVYTPKGLQDTISRGSLQPKVKTQLRL
jgi:hypothetical protein